MKSIKEQLEEKLEELYGYRRFGMVLGLNTTRHLLAGLGNPQDAFRSIHIAGTNGKGSTAAMISAALISAGYCVGRYTSPHLERFNERICVDDVPAPDEELLNVYMAVGAVPPGDREPTFFEFSTAMAFYEFARRKVDWAVVETGMGGRLDSTNVLSPDLCLLTNISLEHQQYLGESLEEIAGEKAGIIKPGATVISGVRSPTDEIIRKKAMEVGARVLEAGTDFRLVPESTDLKAEAIKRLSARSRSGEPELAFRYEGPGFSQGGLFLGLRGGHQRDNAALAAAACGMLKEMGVAIRPEDLAAGLACPAWAGRLEYIPGRPPLLLDGAHNPAAAAALSDYLEEKAKHQPLTMILAVLSDKDAMGVTARLAALGNRVILTTVDADRALPAEDLLKSFSKNSEAGHPVPTLAGRAEEALRLAREITPADGLICVAGSLYLVGEVRTLLR